MNARQVKIAQDQVRNMTSVPMPLLFVRSDADPIADPQAHAELASRLQAPEKEIILRSGEFHEVINETNRAELHDKIAKWCLRQIEKV